ncbi:endolytic transglycosylase MltG [Streptomyces millisiae]|uniref:Endolytic murein transglycosylase n=1 Tax=Streptomyces millisiae TaxID=3075542 RepID=A0ABU2LGJ4_9ACTN|nr:endolytic transglycosylase MltG [Streptomyces sp. DSM 44918]MDT0316719.1 endolytic transglycosylase MltG [Streptomyces sp. DSM 44918]
MTEYGRGSGSEPWYPEDPLYGDQGWSGAYDAAGNQHAQQGHGTWDEYGGQYGDQQQQHPQGHQQQQPYYQQQYDSQQQYGQQGGWDNSGQYYAGDPYGNQQHGQQQAAHQQQGHQQGQQPDGGYGAGQHPGQYQDPYATQQGYAAQPHAGQDPYAQGGGYQAQQQQYGGGGQDVYPDSQGAPAQQAGPPDGDRGPRRDDPGPDPETGWDPGPDQGESDFFTRRDDDWSDAEEDRRGRRGDKPKKKRRGGVGCMVAGVLVLGALGGVAYVGYGMYQDRFGPAPDFAGEGTDEVQVTIPEGSTISGMGVILRDAGVVASADAFVEAAGEDGQSLQPGVYTLRREMAASSAVELMLDPASLSTFTIPEGRRATEVYALIDERLGLEEGTTAEVAETADLGLPDFAEGEVEGFLFPTRYDVGEDTTPEDLLRAMVDRAEAEFTEIDLEGQAEEFGRTPREILIVASLIEAEGQTDEEFGKVSRVIYNRLEQDMMLQFDSTINYALGRSTLDTSLADTELDSPYNTYRELGLPPGPIANPGHNAIEAALNPTEGPWLYFVTVTEGDTRFTDDFAEHEQNVADFNAANQGDG